MYHAFVRAKLRILIAHINAGDWDYVVRQFAPGAEHVFAGSGHALAGARHSPQLIVSWYQRLSRLFPGLRFDVRKVVVSGFPWATDAAIEIYESSTDRQGQPMSNEIVLMMRLRWGRAAALHVYCDTERLQNNLTRLALQGIEEAKFPPITDRLDSRDNPD